MALRKSTKEMLQQAVLAFKLEDFFQYVLREFHQVSQEELSKVISQNHMQISKRQIVRTFLNLLSTKGITNEDCERSIVLLRIQAVALKPESRTWTAWNLFGDPIINDFTDTHVENLVLRSLRRNGIESIIRAVHKSSAFWINITVKNVTQKKGLVLKPPIFCVFFLNHPFIFFSNCNSANIQKSVVEALGFVDYGQCKLSDHDPKSMLKILTTKDTRLEVVQSDELSSKPRETCMGVDFSQHQAKQDYIHHLFPADTPKLSDYTVSCQEAPWSESSKFPEIGDRTCPVSVQLRTKDTVAMFRAMVEEGILDVPVPSYVRRAISCGRNKIKVRVNQKNCTLDQTSYA